MTDRVKEVIRNHKARSQHSYVPNQWGDYLCSKCGIDVLDVDEENHSCEYFTTAIPKVRKRRFAFLGA
mgnify:CR=1 FL=1